jgi:phytoene synthase
MVIGGGTQTQRQFESIWPERHLEPESDYAYCRRVMVGASKNYSFAGQFLPADKRPHVEALYALLRVGDDLVDVSHEGFDSAEAAIDHWQRTYQRAFKHGTSPDPVMRAYLDTAQKFEIPQDLMTPYFKAMRQDLSINRYQTFDDLLDYMDGSALPVGRGMTYILGVRSPYHFQQARAGADALSIAMQLSNFWRDIGEDWRRGRVYLPLEDMARFGVSESQLAGPEVSPELRRLIKYQIERTNVYYRKAARSVPMLAGGRWAVQSGLLIYKAITDNLEQNNYDPFSRRARASTAGKLMLVAKAGLQSAR